MPKCEPSLSRLLVGDQSVTQSKPCTWDCAIRDLAVSSSASMSAAQAVREPEVHDRAPQETNAVVESVIAIETLLADLQRQEAATGRTGRHRSPRYRMVIDGPFIETKEFGGSSVQPRDDRSG